MFYFIFLIQICFINSERLEIQMPNVTTSYKDSYYCTSYKLNSNQNYIINFEALTNSSIAHHMIVYACEKPTSYNSSYECAHNECVGNKKIIFAWGRNAPALNLPNDVSFNVGSKLNIEYIVVNVHYLHKVSNDQSGIGIIFTDKPRKYEAGIFLLLSGYIAIPPKTKQYSSYASCKYNGDQLNVLYVF